MDNKRCLICFSTLDRYYKNTLRLIDKLGQNTNDDFFIFNEYEQINSPTHSENPYAFKIYAIEKAKSMGYNIILWIDSSVYPIKDITPIYEIIEQEGYICQYAGHLAGTWTNDATLSYFGLTRDDAMKIEMYGNCGFLGLNFQNETAIKFFELWKKSMLDGMFKGNWNNETNSESLDSRCKGHRHDMSCGSIIRHQLNMKLKGGEEYLQYVNSEDNLPLNDKIYFFAQGIG